MQTLVLGAGWVGNALRSRIPDALFTHTTAKDGALRFQLEDRSTWSLPVVDRVVWTFPAQPLDAVRAFHSEYLRHIPRVVVLGSTGSIEAPDGHWVNEETPLKDVPRVHGEAFLSSAGAHVARLAGLWGPGRDPVEWLTHGRIADVDRYVNLIHLSGVVETVLALLEQSTPITLNVSDGIPRRWKHHAAHLLGNERAATLPHAGADGHRVGNHALRALLPHHRFTRLTPLTGPESDEAWRSAAEHLTRLTQHAPDEAHAMDHSSTEEVAFSLMMLLEACMEIAQHLQSRGDATPILTWNDAVDAWLSLGIFSSEKRVELLRLGAFRRAHADGYTGISTEDLQDAAVRAPHLLAPLMLLSTR